MKSITVFTGFLAWLCGSLLSTGETVRAAAEPVAATPTQSSARTNWVNNAGERLRLEQAVPLRAPVPPGKARTLLIFDLNVGYGGHASIAYANQAFTLMGEKTGAFQTVVSRDPLVFAAESLRRFDAVFFNNTVGNLFEDPKLRQNLLEFVYGGGGLLGVHGTSVAFTRWPGAIEDWPEFGLLLGARGANHRDSDEHVFIKLDEPDHPINRVFGGHGFEYRDEFFRVHEPYSRNRVRVLFSIDTAKTESLGQARGNVVRADDDYALAWVRHYGRGRIFYCTIAHNPYVFYDPKMLEFYLAAIQFAVGDLPAPTLPSGRLTPALRAQEKLGWRLGLEAGSFPKCTLFEAIDQAAQLGVFYLGAWNTQSVSQEIPRPFDDQLSQDELKQIRGKLEAAGVRLLTYDLRTVPGDEAGCRRLFEFGRKMGIETFLAAPPPEMLDRLEKLCEEFDLRLALRPPDSPSLSLFGRPEEILRLCQGRSPRVGACGDLGSWTRSGLNPAEVLRTLQGRLITLQDHGLGRPDGEGHRVPWGIDGQKTEQCLEEIQRLGIKPTMFALAGARDETDPTNSMARRLGVFNHLSQKLAK